MKNVKVLLCDIQDALVQAWRDEFEGEDSVDIVHGNIFEQEADAIVSPANCTGIMDGGFDLYLREFLGKEIEKTVRWEILQQYDGDLPVGQAIIVETNHPHFPFLVTAPTMRLPANVSQSINAYYAMSAILRECIRHPKVKSVVITGLCSDVGKMPPHLVARQMKAAYDRVLKKKYFFPHWIYEKSFEKYLMCLIDEPANPEEYEI